jgi:voltage-gated potassium channel
MTTPRLPLGRADIRGRLTVLHQLEAWLFTPMLVLSFVWLLLVLFDLVWGQSRLSDTLALAIWVVFIAEFLLRFALAPGKLRFLRSNWLTVIALLAPALRLFSALRFLRFARAARGLRLVRVIGTINRSMNALRASMRRRGFGYVASLTVLVALLGAAGMLAFEPSGASEQGTGFSGYADALWWTSMIITTMGSQYWPQTIEGRILCLFLAVYAFAIFSYVTAAVATFFVGREAASEAREIATAADVEALQAEIAGLRAELRTMLARDGPFP